MNNENRKTVMLLRMLLLDLEAQREEALKNMRRCVRDRAACRRWRLNAEDLFEDIVKTRQRIIALSED